MGFLNNIMKYIDEDGEMVIDKIKDKEIRILPQNINRIEAEWIFEAIATMRYTPILAIRYTYDKKRIEIDKLHLNKYEDLLEYLSDNSYTNIIITNEKVNFMLFQPEGTEYSLFVGNCDFINKAYKCTYKTHIDIFLDEIDMEDNIKRKKYLKTKLDKYIVDRELYS